MNTWEWQKSPDLITSKFTLAMTTWHWFHYPSNKPRARFVDCKESKGDVPTPTRSWLPCIIPCPADTTKSWVRVRHLIHLHILNNFAAENCQLWSRGGYDFIKAANNNQGKVFSAEVPSFPSLKVSFVMTSNNSMNHNVGTLQSHHQSCLPRWNSGVHITTFPTSENVQSHCKQAL